MLVRIVFLVLALLAGAHCLAAEPPAPASSAAGSLAPADTSAALPAATVWLYHRPVFSFRAALLGVSAEDRAARAQARIRAQLDGPGPHQVSAKPDSAGILIQINGATSFIVTAGDTDRLEQESIEAAGERALQALRVAVRAHDDSHDAETMARAAGLGLAATVLLAALVLALQRVRRAIHQRMLRATERHAERLQVAGVLLLRRERMAALVNQFVTLCHWLIVLVLCTEWLGYVLTRFPYTRAWGELVNGFVLGLAERMVLATLRAVPDLFTALVILLIARFATRLLHSFFERVQTSQGRLPWLDADVAVPTRRIAKVVIWLFALAMAYPYLPGAQTEAFKGLSVLVGLMISLGASNLVGQAASGLILTYGRVYRKGEYVCIANEEGTVTELGIFATRLRTGLGEEITLANSTVLAGTTRNYSRTVKGAGFVLDTTVTIGYDTPWRQVHAMLCEAALRTPGVLAEPGPQVFQTALSDWYTHYRLVCQAIPDEPQPRAQVLSALHASIQDVFNEYGVQIMSPQYFEDPPQPKIVPPEKWFTAPARR